MSNKYPSQVVKSHAEQYSCILNILNNQIVSRHSKNSAVIEGRADIMLKLSYLSLMTHL